MKKQPQASSPPPARSGARNQTIALGVIVLVVVAVTIYVAVRGAGPSPSGAPSHGGPSPMARRDRVLGQAEQLLAGGQFRAARDLAEAYLRTDPHDAEVRTALAKALGGMGQPAEAENAVDEALRKDPACASALWFKGQLVSARQGGNEMYFFRQAAEHADETRAGIWSRFGLLLLEAGRPAEAEAQLRKAHDAGLKDPPTLAGLGRIALAGGRYAEAERHLAEATRKDPRNAALWGNLSEAQKALGKTDRAAESLRMGVQVGRGAGRGLLLLKLGQVQLAEQGPAEKVQARAAETFAQAAEYPTVRSPAALRAARCYYFLGRHAQAMKFIDMAALAGGGDPEIARWRKKIEDARFGPPVAGAGDGRSFLDAVRPSEGDANDGGAPLRGILNAPGGLPTPDGPE